MRYEKIDSTLFIENRKRLVERLKPNSVAVFNSSDIMPTSADGTMPFIQQTDIFYLSGIDQEKSILVINPDAKDPAHREMLFLIETNEEIAIWEGAKLTKEQATEVSGIESVYWLSDFDTVFKTVVFDSEHIYLNTNEHLRADTTVETPDDRFRVECMKNFPLHKYERISPIMHDLRTVKSQIEIDVMQKACNITEKGFRRVLEFTKPGVKEYEIEAEITHEFVRNGSRRHAYTPIIASGFNACVLHYIDNDQVCQDGDLLLMDFGCEYGNYASDLTRTIPVNGKFTERQAAVYSAVLRVHKAAAKMLVPGNNLMDYHVEVGKLMTEELVGLGLITREDIANEDPKWPAYKKYFMHGTSHHIGVDVHDYGNRYKTFEAGMVFTVEPGIYIREENMGIRIENDFVIQESGEPFDLMKNIPIEIEEIESIMAK
ncbi:MULTISPECIES: aminopeptidase P family protein [Flammeovirga]|uniref:Xaa-Pro aminopeptidase n=1 Tax=Flammeovirga aprica JL-4 TaxID=694437 RepID=A0A7X9XCS9_9BACT|nr:MULTISPECIES: aminopeptidase P family protein [Flammeovirga]NME72055.1 aminopeptidase P family protein [Flammeovirga aprica JL-4]